jgi:hypothetical protein
MISRGGPGRFTRCSRQMWTRQMWPQRNRTALSWLDLLDQSAQKLHALGVSAPTPFDLEKFLRQLMQLRGRQIVLTPISIRADSSTVCGYCLKLARWDHVFYTQSRSQLHRTHNAVHELAHLVLGHSSVGPLTRPGPGAAVPADQQREQPASWLGLADAGYSERCEDEADAAAAILLGRWQETAPRSWVAHSTMRRGSVRLADAYA